jgi:hypothetical protein
LCLALSPLYRVTFSGKPVYDCGNAHQDEMIKTIFAGAQERGKYISKLHSIGLLDARRCQDQVLA